MCTQLLQKWCGHCGYAQLWTCADMVGSHQGFSTRLQTHAGFIWTFFSRTKSHCMCLDFSVAKCHGQIEMRGYTNQSINQCYTMCRISHITEMKRSADWVLFHLVMKLESSFAEVLCTALMFLWIRSLRDLLELNDWTLKDLHHHHHHVISWLLSFSATHCKKSEDCSVFASSSLLCWS